VLEVLGAVDGASGLPNRRGVIDAIEDAGNRLDRTGEGYAVLHVSVPVLATLGSDDRLEGVRHVGALLTAALRGVDRIGRFDDTSFVAILAEADAAGVAVVARRLSAALGALPLRTGGGELPVELGFAAVVAGARPAPAVDELVGVLVDAALRAEPGPEPVIAMAP
jgi:GGDEF domain-containing protein